MSVVVVNGTPVKPSQLKKSVTRKKGDRRLPKLTNLSPADSKSGSYGTYVKLTKKLGVKIVRRSNDFSVEKPGAARAEYDTLLKCWTRKPRWFPEPIGVVEVEFDGAIFFGVVMEHIEGPTAAKFFNENWDKVQEKMDELKYSLERAGIEHFDLHGNNVVVCKTKFMTRFKIIDADPYFIKINRRKAC
jgi:hypothetical protein